MIELEHNQLVFRFREVHRHAEMRIDLQRTMRIPDDDRTYPLPAGFGRFPLRHVDDYADRVPAKWIDHGGVLFPMYQSEALWLHFSGHYPFAIKVATGKIDAVTGREWSSGLHREPQDYVVVPNQPWLDGYCVGKGIIRQFVAMPLGSGYSAEEQLTGRAEHGGIQIIAYPLKRAVYNKWMEGVGALRVGFAEGLTLSRSLTLDGGMGLAAGGRMRQEIYDDRYDLGDWDTDHASRCFVHIANSLIWRAITGEQPPPTPLTAREYTQAGIPWFDYYAEGETAVEGSDVLGRLESVASKAKLKGDAPLAGNESVAVDRVVHLRKGLAKGQVREGVF